MDEFLRVICGRCGEAFGLDPETAKCLNRSGKSFYCPFGHKIKINPGQDILGIDVDDRCDVEVEQEAMPRAGGLRVIEGGKR